MGARIKLRVSKTGDYIPLCGAAESLIINAVSPVVTFEEVDGGTEMIVTDVDGTKSVVIPDGAQGEDYVLTAEDKKEIADSVMDSEKLSAPVLDEGAAVISTHGGTVPRQPFNASDYVDISDWYAIRYTRLKNMSNQSSYGMAFYDADKKYISGIGSPSAQPEYGYEPYETQIPDGAVYARFTMFADTETFGTFEVYGMARCPWELLHKQDVLSFDDTPTAGSDNPVKSGGIKTAIDVAVSSIPSAADKADKVANATAGNFAGLDANGNLTDSGAKASDFLPRSDYTPVTVDSELSSTSTNPVQNQAITAEVHDIKDLIFSSGFVPVTDPTTWELGGWYSANGGGSNVTNRIRTTQASQVDSLDYYIMADDGALFFPLFYNGSTYIQREKYPWSSVCSIANAAPEGATGFRLTVRSKPITDLTGKVEETAAKIHFYKARKVDIYQGTVNAGKAMIVGADGMIAPEDIYKGPVTETVSGTDPVITCETDHRYICGTVSTLTLTPP